MGDINVRFLYMLPHYYLFLLVPMLALLVLGMHSSNVRILLSIPRKQFLRAKARNSKALKSSPSATPGQIIWYIHKIGSGKPAILIFLSDVNVGVCVRVCVIYDLPRGVHAQSIQPCIGITPPPRQAGMLPERSRRNRSEGLFQAQRT